MEEADVENGLELSYHSEEGSTGNKRKREGKLRSKVWQDFTKILNEEGKCDKCQCNHCQKLFTCSSRSGTTHLLRHITDGICPVFKKDTGKSSLAAPISPFSALNGLNLLTWGTPQKQSMDVQVELDQYDYQMQTTTIDGKLPLQSRMKSRSQKGDAWMNEFRSCVGKLVELANGKVGMGMSSGPDYSVSMALQCLNEMEDISQMSEMYLDAVEIMQDGTDRECFICLPPEPRRRWLQRVLHRRNPGRYSSNL